MHKALTGTWRREHLFTLRQSLLAYRHYQAQIEQCDEELHEMLGSFESRADLDDDSTGSVKGGNGPGFDLQTEFHRIFGVDLTAVPGVGPHTVYTLFAECSRDLSAFASAGDFASWLGLCPYNRITGGKIISARTRKGTPPQRPYASPPGACTAASPSWATSTGTCATARVRPRPACASNTGEALPRG